MVNDFVAFTDDFMFCSVMEDEEKCKELLQRILNIEIAEIKTVCKQKTIDNRKKGKGIRLDIYVKDVLGNKYDIDMQATKEPYLGKRTRYYHSEMDGDSIKKGMKYNNLKKSIVIFICTYDCFGDDRCVYTFKSICDENKGIYLNDERETIILNAFGNRNQIDEKLRNFLDYVKTGDAEDDFTKSLADSVEELNHDKNWRNEYVTYQMKMDQKYDQGYEAGKAKGRESLLISKVCLKMSKGKTVVEMADELEEASEKIERIYNIAQKYAPDYDEDQILLDFQN